MATSTDCQQNPDPLKLIREGTSQNQRLPVALDPGYAPVDGRTTAHGMVFADSYAALLKYFDATNSEAGDWTVFFGNDVSVRLAVVAVEDADAYKRNIKSYLDYLDDRQNRNEGAQLRNHLGFLYSSLGTLARQLDLLKEALPADIALKGTLQNLIRSQLAPAFRRLIAYYKAGSSLALVNSVAPSSGSTILRAPVTTFAAVLTAGLSTDWSAGRPWEAYVTTVLEDPAVYGDATADVFVRINHCATHALFRSIFEQFLKVFARTVSEAALALEGTLNNWDRHEPHYALFLAFLRLLEHLRADINTLTRRHLDFYYREILRLQEKPSEAAHAHLLVELAKHVGSHQIQAGELFKAGKDELGRDVFFANDRAFVANQAQVAALRTVYRHTGEAVSGQTTAFDDTGRLFASPVADSDDGLGAALPQADQSWHPFFNKRYVDGALGDIRMPKAEVGFAIASHYLSLAEGSRTITIDFTVDGNLSGFSGQPGDVSCLLTSEKEWHEVDTGKLSLARLADDKLRLQAELGGEFPAVRSYSAKAHGYGLATNLPVLLVKLQHRGNAYRYAQLQDLVLKQIDLTVTVSGLRTLAVSNDFGPVDSSKPFQPFGASPVAGNALIVGSREAFQKTLNAASLELNWLATPLLYPSGDPLPSVSLFFLNNGLWVDPGIDPVTVDATSVPFSNNLGLPTVDTPDFATNEFYSTASRHGFAKLELSGDFGQDAYQTALLRYLRKDSGASDPGKQPLGPTMSSLAMSYTARQRIDFAEGAASGKAQYFHLAPFGQVEQPAHTDAPVYLLPRFAFQYDNRIRLSEAEFYVGVTGLAPPQNLALLFEVADGTANPLVKRPMASPLVFWSYLSNNVWIDFREDEVQDGSGELLNSGIITFAVPAQATSTNTLLPAGMFWIRAAVSEKSDAVCRLRMVAAQAVAATFVDHGNAPRFAATTVDAGTIRKLERPTAAVKSLVQPFPSFGGRNAELPEAFYTRISERLRHKDRAIALWDYERLILEAFPQIYKVKCLNHTQYEPSDTGEGVYREMAPGHVTIVTIPDLRYNKLRDPLRPYTSLALLEKIEAFLQQRNSCFARLHVRNPEFEELQVDFRVRLREGFDETYYANQLRQAITRFLAPWAFTGSGSPSFGGRIYKSVLINFVEEQPCVDYVTDFKLFHRTVVGKQTISVEKDEVAGSKALSILVSVPADKHQVVVIRTAAANSLNETCPCDA